MNYFRKSLARKLVLAATAFVLVSVVAMTAITYYFLSNSEEDKLIATHKAMMLTIDLYREDIKGVVKDAKEAGPDGIEKYIENSSSLKTLHDVLTKLNEDVYIGRPYLMYPDMEPDLNGDTATKMLGVSQQLLDLGSTPESYFPLPQIFIDAKNIVTDSPAGIVTSTPPYNDGDGDWMSTISKVVDEDGTWIADFGIDFKYSYVKEKLREALVTSIIAGLSVALLGALVSWIFIRRILKPLKDMTESIQQASEGDFTNQVEVKGMDELSSMADHFNLMLDGLEGMIRRIRDDAQSVMENSRVVSETSKTILTSSQETQESMEIVSRGSEEQMSSLTETARSLEEVASASQKIAESASSLASNSEGVYTEVLGIQKFASNAVDAMNRVQESSAESYQGLEKVMEFSSSITSILSIIQSISQQTNLLSLNASIEAARAGDAGKGFAVVANEIRKLADESGKSSKEISEIIKGVLESVEVLKHVSEESSKNVVKGIEVIERVNGSVDSIVEQMEDVNMQVQEVSAATEQMSASSEEISATVEQLDNISKSSLAKAKVSLELAVTQVASTNELSTISEKLVSSANSVIEELERFKLK